MDVSTTVPRPLAASIIGFGMVRGNASYVGGIGARGGSIHRQRRYLSFAV